MSQPLRLNLKYAKKKKDNLFENPFLSNQLGKFQKSLKTIVFQWDGL